MFNFVEKRHKLVVLISVLLCLGFVTTSFISYYVSAYAIRQNILHNELPLTSDNIYSEIQKDLIRPTFISSVMAHDTFLHDWVANGEVDVDKLTRYLREIKQTYHAFTSFFISEQTLRYYHADGVLKTVSQKDGHDAWYFRMRQMDVPSEIKVDTDQAHQNALTIFIDYKVVDANKKFIGIAGVGLTVDTIRQLIDSYQSQYQRTVYFVDKTGNIVLSGTRDRTVGGINIYHIEGLKQQAANILASDQGTYQYEYGGHRQLLNVRYIPELSWYVFVEKNGDDAVSSIRRTLYLNLVICIAITSIVLLLINLCISRYQAQVEQMAASDYLTKLPNRLLLNFSMQTAMRECVRDTQALSVVMIDIDNFKHVNDVYGHLAGDDVLRNLAALLKQHLRDADFICRWGGEEFMLLLKDCNGGDAVRLSEKLRCAIANTVMTYERQPIPITASFGVAEWRGANEDARSLIKRADHALYEAKTQGRNCCILAD